MTVKLTVQPRVKNSGDIKSEHIPAVVYGHKFASTAISVDKKEFEKTFKTAGESTIIELEGLDRTVEVLVKDVVFAPVKGGIMHVDFYAVEMGKEMETHVPLHFIGEAPAEKLGGVINKVLHEVEIVCKPKDLPAHIDIDLSMLVTFEDKIHVSDIVAPKGVKITNDADDVVALAEEVAEDKPAEEVVNAADVPVEGKGKVESE
jgi:large subunit ribosomal protein L25